MQISTRILTGVALAGLAACGGGGSGADASGAGNATGTINIAITDAAVDDVTEVWVQFTAVTLKPASGEAQVYAFDTPKDYDLLSLQNGVTAELLPDTRVPVGEYEWIRLAVNAEFDNVYDSYVMTDNGSQLELRVPSGSQSGLKLVSGITVTQNRSTNIVLDWDLRKALTDPPGQPGLHLRPALRVTDMASYGTLEGTVEAALVDDETCTNDLVAGTGNAVYVWAGVNEMPSDIDGSEADPLVTAAVTADTEGVYRFSVPYLSIGEYSVAFTCQALDDDPEVADGLAFPAVETGIVVEHGATTTVDLVVPAG